MALASAYATKAEYKARTGQSGTAADAAIDAQLLAVSRYFDLRTNRPNGFNQDDTVQARYYNGRGDPFLRVDDLATATGLTVKVDLDGDQVIEATLTINTDFWLLPLNAAQGPEPRPFTELLLNPQSSVLSAFPIGVRNVEVEGTHGWPAVPGMVREAVVKITRQMRDQEEGGEDGGMTSVDSFVRRDPNLTALMMDVERMYGLPHEL